MHYAWPFHYLKIFYFKVLCLISWFLQGVWLHFPWKSTVFRKEISGMHFCLLFCTSERTWWALKVVIGRWYDTCRSHAHVGSAYICGDWYLVILILHWTLKSNFVHIINWLEYLLFWPCCSCHYIIAATNPLYLQVA